MEYFINQAMNDIFTNPTVNTFRIQKVVELESLLQKWIILAQSLRNKLILGKQP